MKCTNSIIIDSKKNKCYWEFGCNSGIIDFRLKDFFENIDLSDNDIKRLGNITLLKRYLLYLCRLKTLNLSNNKISKMTDVSDSLPNLENLNLMNNKITDINEIFLIRNCTKLKRLILYGNVVT